MLNNDDEAQQGTKTIGSTAEFGTPILLGAIADVSMMQHMRDAQAALYAMGAMAKQAIEPRENHSPSLGKSLRERKRLLAKKRRNR